jgi:tetratricopeptide (TPR) repeat protein
VRLEPQDLEGRVGLGRVYSWSGKFATAIATFDTVLTREADYRDAALARAQAYAWWGRYDEALAAYAAWRRGHPADVEAALSVARTLSWAGRLDDAATLYDSLAVTGGSDAAKGHARVRGWKGDLDGSEREWQALSRTYADDPEVWVGLAQVQRWQGRPFAARDALDEALRLRPGYEDAREQMRWVRAETAPQLSATVVLADDSEDNTVESERIGASVSRRWGGVWSLAAERKVAGAARDATANGLRGGLVWQPEGTTLTLRGDLGLAALQVRGGTSHTVATLAARLALPIGERVRVSAGIDRSPIDEVSAAIARGVAVTAFDADASVRLPARFTLALAAGAASASGLDPSHSRTNVLARAQWNWRRNIAVTLTARSYGWNRPALGVFFAPQEFSLTEIGASWERPRDLGYVLRLDAGLGAQSVRFDGGTTTHRTTPRGTVTTGWRFSPGREVTLAYVFANVANSATLREGEYRYSAFTLAGRFAY